MQSPITFTQSPISHKLSSIYLHSWFVMPKYIPELCTGISRTADRYSSLRDLRSRVPRNSSPRNFAFCRHVHEAGKLTRASNSVSGLRPRSCPFTGANLYVNRFRSVSLSARVENCWLESPRWRKLTLLSRYDPRRGQHTRWSNFANGTCCTLSRVMNSNRGMSWKAWVEICRVWTMEDVVELRKWRAPRVGAILGRNAGIIERTGRVWCFRRERPRYFRIAR